MPKLSGRVTVHKGAKLARSAVVELHNVEDDILDQVQVDDEGHYIYHLVPGTWRLKAWDAHGHRGAADVRLTEEGDVVQDLDLDEPEGGH